MLFFLEKQHTIKSIQKLNANLMLFAQMTAPLNTMMWFEREWPP